MTSLDQPDFSSIFQNYLEKLKENFTEKELNELKAGKLVAKVEIKTKTMMEKLENFPEQLKNSLNSANSKQNKLLYKQINDSATNEILENLQTIISNQHKIEEMNKEILDNFTLQMYIKKELDDILVTSNSIENEIKNADCIAEKFKKAKQILD